MTEPSQEAVEFGWVIKYDDPDRPDEVFAGSGAEGAARARFKAISDHWNATLFVEVAALRALEQRTRLETLERAAKFSDKAYALAMYVLQSRLYQSDMDVREAVDAVLALHAEIASLQPREACPHGPHVHEVFRSGVKEGEITCDGPREAPKAEEPKR